MVKFEEFRFNNSRYIGIEFMTPFPYPSLNHSRVPLMITNISWYCISADIAEA